MFSVQRAAYSVQKNHCLAAMLKNQRQADIANRLDIRDYQGVTI
jgi:ribosomal protein S13